MKVQDAISTSLEELFQRLAKVDDLGGLWALAVGYFAERGFGALAYLLFDGRHSDQAVALLDSGFPPESVQAYEDLGYGRHDPTLRVVMSTGQPETPDRVAQRVKLSRQEQHHRDIIQGFGVGVTLNLPLFGPYARNACAILGRPSDPAALDETNWTALHLAAQAMHLHGFKLQPQLADIRDHGLSQREIEILRWVAQGKSNSVIATILGISGGTVDTYLRRVFEKMDVTDRTAAAVKGVSMGLIRV